MNSDATTPDLCALCGLCCNGWIVESVELTADEARALRDVPVVIQVLPHRMQMPQPCACYDGGCSRYESRPARCRQFQCLTLDALASGDVTFDTAEGRIARAKAAVASIERCLMNSGWTEPGEPGPTAWRRFVRAMRAAPDPAAFRRAHRAVLLTVIAYDQIARAVLVPDLTVD